MSFKVLYNIGYGSGTEDPIMDPDILQHKCRDKLDTLILNMVVRPVAWEPQSTVIIFTTS